MRKYYHQSLNSYYHKFLAFLLNFLQRKRFGVMVMSGGKFLGRRLHARRFCWPCVARRLSCRFLAKDGLKQIIVIIRRVGHVFWVLNKSVCVESTMSDDENAPNDAQCNAMRHCETEIRHAAVPTARRPIRKHAHTYIGIFEFDI
jgi:hypothetical protein